MIRGSRRRSREVTLQILYQLDANPELDPGDAVTLYFRELAMAAHADGGPVDEDSGPVRTAVARDLDREWITLRVAGVARERNALDKQLTEVSRNWRVDRMSRLDRSILRLGLFELLFDREQPRQVTINEAIELAKRYGSAEAPAFVNGILDSAGR